MVKQHGSACLKVTIIGNTSWGNTLGALLSDKGIEVKLWARSEAEAESLNQGKRNYSFTSYIGEALKEADLVIWAVPSQRLRQNVSQAKNYLTNSMILMSAAKGLEVNSGKRMSQVLAEEIAPSLRGQICVLSGPNLAKEIGQALPAASVIAAQDITLAERARKLMESPEFSLSTSDDIIGVELGGAMKNIIALGAGMIDGLDLGDNAKGAFIAWGWNEVVSLGLSLGARASTFYGLAGLGDLIATCSSTLSRNHYVGYELAKGRSLSEISASMPNVAEGVFTTEAAHQLARNQALDLPIINLMYGILFEGLSPGQASIDFKELTTSHQRFLD
ncbi:MAG: NAD(P)-dependent glycerol-3-phosphate dehydrogenase [Chloroflexota bacterium]|nr:MAG: NAD(P)-dependent glycerol-3-phosphate dehydrogenase [Chloroflexota bacterium]